MDPCESSGMPVCADPGLPILTSAPAHQVPLKQHVVAWSTISVLCVLAVGDWSVTLTPATSLYATSSNTLPSAAVHATPAFQGNVHTAPHPIAAANPPHRAPRVALVRRTSTALRNDDETGEEKEEPGAPEPQDAAVESEPSLISSTAAGSLAVAGTGAAAAAAGANPKTLLSRVNHFVEIFSNLFPIWTVMVAAIALNRPDTFSFMTTDSFTVALSALMFSMGITLTFEDLKRVVRKPLPVGINFLACYALMPGLAYVIAKVFSLSPAFTAGLVMVGAINGGQASNLCAYIARGDVALSVLMTTATTFGCIFMTPLLAWLVLGAIVPVDPVGIAQSTIQIVLLPILLGGFLNSFAPRITACITPLSPLIGIAATIVLVGASVSQSAPVLLSSGGSLQLPVILLHVLGGLGGYLMCRLAGQGEKVGRTTALETAMKSSAFVYLLCSIHFAEYMVRVPCAVSVVWNAIIGSSMAVLWRFIPFSSSSSGKNLGRDEKLYQYQ